MVERPLSELLRRVGRRVLLTEAGRATGFVLTALLAAALGAVFLDAVLALPTAARLAVNALAVVAIVAAGTFIVRRISASLLEPRRAARQVEQSLGLRDNRLINALDLSESPSPASSSALREKAVRRGDDVAAEIEPKSAVALRPLYRAMAWAAGAAAVMVLCWVTMPGVFAAVLPRYFDPSGDHPPFTLVTFDVTVNPELARFGKPASITARFGGPEEIRQADVVFLQADERGRLRPGVRLAMLRGHDGEFLLPIDRVEKSQEFYVDTPRGRSGRLALSMLEVPTLEKGEVVYRFPKYTGWESTSHPLDARGMRGLSGTVAEISAQGNMPLKTGRIELFRDGEEQPHATIAMTPAADARTVRGAAPISFTGRYRVTITAPNGSDCPEPLEGKIVASTDRAPQVGIVHPEPQLIVVEGYTIPISIQATDDVGIGRIELRASINGWGPTPVDVEADLREPTVARAFAEFNLPALGAKSGDVITYSAIAWDRFPPDGKFAESATHVIQVISEAEYLEYARSEYQMNEILAELDELQKKLDEMNQQRDKVMEELETLQKKLKEEGNLSPEDKKKMDDLAKDLERLEKQMEQFAKETHDRASQEPLYELEKPMLDLMEKLSESLDKQADLARQAADALERLRKDPTDEKAKKDLEQALEELDKQREKDAEAGDQREQLEQEMNRLSKVDEMVAQGEKMQDIIERQRELADRLGEFRNRESLTPDEQRRADRLAREQERLRQELDETVNELEETAKQCQGECPRTAGDAMKLCKAAREMKIGEDQGQAAGNARKGDGRKSHEAAESAAEKLESLAGQCPGGEGAGEEMEASNDPGLKLCKSGLKQSLKQLSQGRQMPGLRGMPGQKPGQMPGQAQGSKPGSKPGQKPGKGDGMRGSMAKNTILGPHAPMGDNKSKPRPGQRGKEGPSDQLADRNALDGRDAESLTPDGRTNPRSSAGNLRGVPAPFRDQVEQYFRRLAEQK